MPWNCEQSFVKFWKELITISSHYTIVAFLEKISEYWNHRKKRGCFTCKLCWHVKVYVYVHFTSVCQVDMLKSHGHGQLFLVQEDIWHPWPITSSNARNAFSRHHCLRLVHQTLWNCHWLSAMALLQNNFFAFTIWAWIKPCSCCVRSNSEHLRIVWENRKKSSWMLEPFLSSIVCVAPTAVT